MNGLSEVRYDLCSGAKDANFRPQRRLVHSLLWPTTPAVSRNLRPDKPEELESDSPSCRMTHRTPLTHGKAHQVSDYKACFWTSNSLKTFGFVDFLWMKVCITLDVECMSVRA